MFFSLTCPQSATRQCLVIVLVPLIAGIIPISLLNCSVSLLVPAPFLQLVISSHVLTALHVPTERNKAVAAAAQAARRELRVARVQKVRQLLESDPLYRLLHCTVAVLFAQQLQKDVEDAKAGKRFGSLAAKWAPTPHRKLK